MTVHLWRNQYSISNSAELLFSLDIPRGPKTCSNPNQNLGVWFHRVIEPSKRKVEKIENLRNKNKKRIFNSRNLKFFKAQKLENVESFSNHQTRIDKNRLSMPWNRYTRRTPDNVSADDMSLKRGVPQIGTDGQWPYDRVPDETIKYLLGQYFEILTYKWSTRGHMMSHVMNFISRPFLRHPSPMVTFFAPIKMRLFNFWVVSLKISINKIASILRVSEFGKFSSIKKIQENECHFTTELSHIKIFIPKQPIKRNYFIQHHP